MSEEKASPCVLHIHGENIQVLPNAMFAIQYICLDPGEKPEVVSEKDVRPDPEPCDLLASYIQDEEVRHDFVKRIAQCQMCIRDRLLAVRFQDIGEDLLEYSVR